MRLHRSFVSVVVMLAMILVGAAVPPDAGGQGHKSSTGLSQAPAAKKHAGKRELRSRRKGQSKKKHARKRARKRRVPRKRSTMHAPRAASARALPLSAQQE